MDLLFWLISSALVCIMVLFGLKKIKPNPDPRLAPKLPGGLPFIGHAHYFLGNPVYIWERMKKMMETTIDSGGVLRMSLGPLQYNLVTDPDDCLLVSNTCLSKDSVYDVAKSLVDNGLVNGSVDIWRRHRKLLLPAYNQQVLDRYMPAFNQHSRVLVDRLAAKAGKDAFDQNRDLEQTTLEISFETTMGIKGFNEYSMDQFLKAVIDFFESRVLYKLAGHLYHNFFMRKTLETQSNEVNEVIHTVADTIIQNKRAELEENPTGISSSKFKSVLDILLAEGSLTDLEIRDEVITTIIASYDTTAITMTLALVLIATYPEVQEKLHEELDKIYEGSDRDVDKEDFSKLPYLDAVLKETIRLYPGFPIISRYVHEDVQLKNHTLKAGTNCVMCLYGTQRSPLWGPDAEEFKPERWIEGDLPSHAFVAFSFGKRNCIGQKFAMMLMKTMLSHILRNYRVYGDHSKVKIKYLVMLKPVSGHEIRIERRTRQGERKRAIGTMQ